MYCSVHSVIFLFTPLICLPPYEDYGSVSFYNEVKTSPDFIHTIQHKCKWDVLGLPYLFIGTRMGIIYCNNNAKYII